MLITTLKDKWLGEVKSNFYTYHQNNTGGVLNVDPDKFISKYVIVEAGSDDQADRIAESIGLYFDGAGDCTCCGDRWAGAWASDATDEPKVDGKKLIELDNKYIYGICYGVEEDEFPIYVHYLDGRIVGVDPRR